MKKGFDKMEKVNYKLNGGDFLLTKKRNSQMIGGSII